jgi:hypothetical protein
VTISRWGDNHCVLLWDVRELVSGGPAYDVLGQKDFQGNGENGWQAVRHDTLCWPYGVRLHRGRMAIADRGNNRVVMWTVNLERVVNRPGAGSNAANPNKIQR